MTARKRVAVWVSNDLNFDQRVAKTCQTLKEQAGNRTSSAGTCPIRCLMQVRFLRRGWRWAPKVVSVSMLNCNWPCGDGSRLVGVVRRDLVQRLGHLGPRGGVGKLSVMYDSHEYFTEAAGLDGTFKKMVWRLLERWAFRKLPCMITVNDSIAEAYRAAYGMNVRVVRNMPRRQPKPVVEGREAFLAHGVPVDLPIALMQGAYMDRDRGRPRRCRFQR